nr:MAG TPA: hypothetical protein [Caudoviricetes sp.]
MMVDHLMLCCNAATLLILRWLRNCKLHANSGL